jgi:2-ketocyclohexanecarboxyl-CoA hydrolase
MGSVDPGYGTAFLARVVGEKKAREIWYLPPLQRRRGRGHGPGQRCVPHDQLDAEVQKWARDLERSPTALAIAKRSFNMDTAHQAASPAWACTRSSCTTTPKSRAKASTRFKEKRKPEFRKYAK